MIYLTRTERFNTAHKMWKPPLGVENQGVFDTCVDGNLHGHDQDLFVTEKGTPDSYAWCVTQRGDAETHLRRAFRRIT